ncbi:hypothetical protein NQ318_006203 [Aromia moschata]|uniref:Uncharacterized protein n=1 Tax=Aromia moschata TaxID=1265417 RepID=A0AAV8YH48_9CUCU|nr:hypothetical protein NQ318_006203 [Aromia moschata]
MNSVDFLLTNKDITYEIRTEIKRLGRPIPDLIISKTDVGKSEIVHEILIVVSTTDLMMGGNQSAWTQEGVSDLKHLNERAKKHASYNEKHLHNILDFSVLGKVKMNILREIIKKIPQSTSLISNATTGNRQLLNITSLISNKLSCLTIQGLVLLPKFYNFQGRPEFNVKCAESFTLCTQIIPLVFHNIPFAV